MASPKETRIKKIDEMLSTLRKNPKGNKETIKSYEDEKKMLRARIDKSAKVQARKGSAAEGKAARKQITQKGMTDAESIFASFLVGGGIATGILKTLMQVKGIADVVSWFGGLKNKPSLPTVVKQIEKQTGKKVALPKPPAKLQLQGPPKPQLPVPKPAPKPPARTDAKLPTVTKPAPKQMKLPSAKTTGAAINRLIKTVAATAAIHGGTSAVEPPEPTALAAPVPRKKPAKPVQTEGISKRKDDMSGRKYKEKRKKDKEDTLKRDMTKAKSLRSALDDMSAAERKSLGPITNFMEKALGLNRDKAAIERDMYITKKLEEEQGFIGGNKRGGRISKPTKKYAMNRGGKVASVRKPTRA